MSAEDDPRMPSEQLADDLRKQIRSGAIKPGQKLPSVREMVRDTGLGSATVQKALSRLRNEGLVFTTQRGSFAHDSDTANRPAAAPVTQEQFATLEAQLRELAQRVQTLESERTGRTDA
ncbi:GntR family transcriptional regulator [Streptomyces armeniacus]|nr:GntR family transcriptional regulator [Streptomyces armeniacus]